MSESCEIEILIYEKYPDLLQISQHIVKEETKLNVYFNRETILLKIIISPI